ncbi:hypothetical protein GA0070560_10487 [Micromonospora halophytica]|uniref:Uncharacterized protein n=2 Tax=Micromonospora halophytica TaxID=47864 RepID=A0A1C5HFB5_9ACTN|nr:hypothetical protein GA0070560_10487 [Micromonospora halophytica]
MDFRRSDSADHPAERARSERLLDAARTGASGDVDPLARLLSAAAGPTRPGELAGEDAAVAAFRAARAAGPAAVAPPRRRRGLTTGVVAWIAGVAATATAGVAFAAVTIDRPTGPERPPRPSAPAPTSADDTPDRTGTPTGGTSSGGPSATPGPVPSTAAGSDRPGAPGGPAGTAQLTGLCRGYLAKPAAQREKALRTPAYADLVDAAGGAERVDAYCQGLVPEQSPAAVSPEPSRARPTPEVRPSRNG